MEENSDYRNLMNEYRDGILLFEIANSKVWNRAAKDKDGMDAFFAANREKYTWEQPHFKSYVIFCRKRWRNSPRLLNTQPRSMPPTPMRSRRP